MTAFPWPTSWSTVWALLGLLAVLAVALHAALHHALRRGWLRSRRVQQGLHGLDARLGRWTDPQARAEQRRQARAEHAQATRQAIDQARRRNPPPAPGARHAARQGGRRVDDVAWDGNVAQARFGRRRDHPLH